MLSLPSPSQSWGIEIPGSVGECEPCGGPIVLEARCRSVNGRYWEGDRGHCADCGTAHEITIDTGDDDAWIAQVQCAGPWVTSDVNRCPDCGFHVLDHTIDGTVDMWSSYDWRHARGVCLLGGLVPTSARVIRPFGLLVLKVPCTVLAKRRRAARPDPTRDASPPVESGPTPGDRGGCTKNAGQIGGVGA